MGNDAISPIKVGSEVRARVFKDQVYAGSWNFYAAGSRDGGLGSWNDVISSMRVEPANRSELCADVLDEEFAVFRDSNLRGDVSYCRETGNSKTRMPWGSPTTASRAS